MQKIINLYVSTFLMFSLVLVPGLVLAKDNEGGRGSSNKASTSLESKTKLKIEKKEEKEKKEERKEEKKSENKQKECLRAFGHLIAPGWIKQNSPLPIGLVCSLPFGIGKKFGGNASSTPDTIAPVISNIAVDARINGAVVRWNTSERTDGVVFYGTTTPVNLADGATKVAESGFWNTRDHKVAISGLSASTTYFGVIRSKDGTGNMATSETFSFTTLPTPPDNIAPVLSSIVTIAGTSTIEVGWKTNEPATGKLYYGTITPLSIGATTTASVEDTVMGLNHVFRVSALATSTPYRFIIESRDSSGNIGRSTEFQVNTLGN